MVKQKILDFAAAQKSFRQYGATDTEPDRVFQVLLNKCAAGEAPKIPRTAEDWDLYTDMPGVSVAAKVLCMIATELAIEIENLPLKYHTDLKTLVQKECWRLY